MRYVIRGFVLLCVLGLGWCATHLKPLSLDEELKKVSASDLSAFDAVLSEAGLSRAQCEALPPLPAEYTNLDDHPCAIAVDDGRIVTLSIAHRKLPKIDTLVQLSALRSLALDDDQLESLAALTALHSLQSLDVRKNHLRDIGTLSEMSSLKILRVANNPIASLQDVRDLPQLDDLDVSFNAIADLSPLASLPSLTHIDIRGNPISTYPQPLPAQWKKVDHDDAQDAAFVAASRPRNWVADLPSEEGHFEHLNMTGKSADWEGNVDSMRGVVKVWPLPGTTTFEASGRTVRIGVREGRVRAYVQFEQHVDFARATDGWLFAEATPDHPATVTGALSYMGAGGHRHINDDAWQYFFYLESVDGTARDVTFSVDRQH